MFAHRATASASRTRAICGKRGRSPPRIAAKPPAACAPSTRPPRSRAPGRGRGTLRSSPPRRANRPARSPRSCHGWNGYKDLRQGAAPVGDCGTKERAHARWGRLGPLRFVMRGLDPCIQGRRLRDYHAAPWMTGTGAESGPRAACAFSAARGRDVSAFGRPGLSLQTHPYNGLLRGGNQERVLRGVFASFEGKTGSRRLSLKTLPF